MAGIRRDGLDAATIAAFDGRLATAIAFETLFGFGLDVSSVIASIAKQSIPPQVG